MTTKYAMGAALAVLSGVANAQSVVFENLPDLENAAFADTSGVNPQSLAADDFSLASSETIGSIEFWGVWAGGTVGLENFTAVFYADAAGNPGSVIASISLVNTVSTTTGAVLFGLDEYFFTADLSAAFDAQAGTTYYLSILNDSGLGEDGSWGWESSSAGTGAWLSTDSGSSFDFSDAIGGFSFRLVNVPTPASAALLGMGAMLGARRRR